MKKLIFANLIVFILFVFMMIIPWNTNFASAGCDEFSNKTSCKNSLIISQEHIYEKAVPEIVPCLLPFDDMVIKI